MLDNLTTTEILAALIGLYFLSAGIGMMAERGNIAAMFKALTEQPFLGYLGGLIAFVIGGTIIAVHNNWDGFLAGFVSLIGWIALLEGVLMLACGKWFLSLFEPLASKTGLVSVFGVATALAGTALLWAALVT